MSAFETAVTDSKKLTSKPNSDDLLSLYGISFSSPLPLSHSISRSIYTAPFSPQFQWTRANEGYRTGLYKVAHGEDISKAETPGMFDIKGKSKKKAWQAVVDEGIDAETAKQRYVDLVEKMKVTYGYDANKAPEEVGAGA
ncbi:hypothetical protein HYFRA_00001129 [Hymenoscyphus fraxineus]|uniref:ACB domain-containing protein n=1 Tax=Hymenoscyphus fraxineus TaxID=746836 RepID=A0A9N9KUR6_9HELO|nr:hypothetical protein HYFRA_00001129 [Hymenoscyphus fraxineus]